ncbi:tight junction associated protein 1 (peripheral), isoform CRA_f [Homo sapiens]|nr:tight junction associated protein 1 (peripheral), isoform CRA_f [Homo sapiens]
MTSAAPAKKPYRKAPPEHRELRLEIPGSRLEQEEPLTDAERMKLLQEENEELRRRLASATRRTEALERELEIGQDCLELELGQSREELDKFKDKFRRRLAGRCLRDHLIPIRKLKFLRENDMFKIPYRGG